jgi:hypothetical protein
MDENPQPSTVEMGLLNRIPNQGGKIIMLNAGAGVFCGNRAVSTKFGLYPNELPGKAVFPMGQI